ncbi:putative Prefoldin subunit 3 [Paratrimastix pyriformis]|uniref:Prefoldin subunit 3 n=1 Tax=Paratrimastix pyriformis TaxID=342808 RepID=A0ABQ8UH28_9EUKA|nr:putative Prefoldin subunit 3 [Paratrimastix pyriformis]|eukprot:GAFH01004654.1.p1 GENE.GAFH01004654.1~~GAFH01004654.1.p1  ORF type:complete len:216 (-),score=52.79 GAFH01004654.1:107-727(-)
MSTPATAAAASQPAAAPGRSQNPRGIPPATFIEDLDTYMADKTAEEIIGRLQDMYSKYKFMEMKLQQQMANLKAKIPEIKNTAELVQRLQEAKENPEPLAVDFELADTIYAKGVVDKTNTVGLWLGANVMLEYTYDDAQALLIRNASQAETTLAAVREDLDFLKEQITISEVMIARVFNWDVKIRRQKRAQGESPAPSPKPAEAKD